MDKKFRNNYNIPNIDNIKDINEEEKVNQEKYNHPDFINKLEYAEQLNPDDFE